MEKKGYSLVLLTALVSGFSIFLNKFAINGIPPILFTALKNSLVAIAIISLVLLLKNRDLHKILDKRVFFTLLLIGFLGGCIPFVLFFTALKLSNSVLAGFVHKTLFLWVAAFAVLFLREKIDRRFIFAAGLLFLGNLLFFSPTLILSFPLLLILLATIFWALENVISKFALNEFDLSGSMVALGRMFFGSLFLLVFLFLSNQAPLIFSLSFTQLQWIALSAVFLFLYVFTYYNGLKHLPVHKAASILLLAQPLTALLSTLFLGKTLGLMEAIGLLLIVCGVIVVGATYFFSFFKSRSVSLAGQ